MKPNLILLLLLMLLTLPARGEGDLQIRALMVPIQQATLSAPITDRIKAMEVDESDSFAQGDPLVIFQCDTIQPQLEQARAELQIQQHTLQTHRKMEQMHSISRLEVAISQARNHQAAAELEIIETEAKRCTITAPFDGSVTKRHAQPHESVKRGAELIDMISHHSLRIELHPPSRWLHWLKVGTPFTLQVDETGRRYAATVSAIGTQINPVSQTIKLFGVIEQPEQTLLPGMSGAAYFHLEPG